MRRILISLLIAITLLTADVQATPLEITYNPMPFNLPSMVQRDQGYLEQLGFDVEYNTFLAGYAMTEAMAANRLDIAPVMGGTSVITSVAGGRGIKIINTYSRAPQGFALVTTDNRLSLSSLKGASIALPVGTEAHLLLARILEEQGLSLADVRIQNMMVPDAVIALQNGQVDGAMVVEPVLTRLEHANQVEILRDGEGLITGLTFSVVPRNTEDEVVQAFQVAHGRSLELIENDLDYALAVAKRETDIPIVLIEKIAPKYDFNPDIDDEVISALQETVEFLYQEQIIRRKVDVSELF